MAEQDIPTMEDVQKAHARYYATASGLFKKAGEEEIASAVRQDYLLSSIACSNLLIAGLLGTFLERVEKGDGDGG